MSLFADEAINITRIYAIEKYLPRKNDPPIVEYSTCLHTHELIFFLSGRGETHVGGTEILDEPNAIRYLPKGQMVGRYTVRPIEPMTCIDIYFDTDSPMPSLPLGIPGLSELRDRFLKLYDLWQRRESGYYAQAMAQLYGIIAAFQRRGGYLSSGSRAQMQAAHAYLQAHYTDRNFDYAALCRASGLGYAQFSELFRRAYGTSPVRAVTAARITRAKELLHTGRHSVSEIAAFCGFANVYYFSTVFKKQTGFSPSSYPHDGE